MYLVSIFFFLLLAVSSFTTRTLTYYSWVQNLYNHFGELAGFTKGKLSIPFSLGCPLLRAKKKKAYLYPPKDGITMLLTPLFLIAEATQVPIHSRVDSHKGYDAATRASEPQLHEIM